MISRHRLAGGAALALLAFGVAQAVPPRAGSWVEKGLSLRADGDIAGAAAAFDRAVAIDPRNADALINAGNLVRDRFGLMPALPWYERALQVAPDHRDVLFEKAATLGDAGQSGAMLAVTRRLMMLSRNNAQASYLQAVLAARAAKWDLARTILYRAGDRMDGIAGMRLMRAILMMQAGANDAAIVELRLVTDDLPDNAKARRLLGLALWRAASFAEAVDVLRPLAERGDGYALVLTGRALEALGNRAAAADALDRAARAGAGILSAEQLAALDMFVTNNPANPAALRAAADRALSRGEFAAAGAIYDALSARLGRRDPVRLVNAGWAEIGQNRVTEAAKLGARAYALAPMNPLVTASYGAFLARAGRAAEAVPILEKAVAMAPDERRFAEELAAARKAR